MLELLESICIPKAGDLLTGTVIESAPEGIWIEPDQPSKSEIFIPAQDLESFAEAPAVGSASAALILDTETDGGYMTGSVSRAIGEALSRSKATVTVSVTQVNKGGAVGYVHAHGGLKAFIPRSHLALSAAEDMGALEGRNLEAVTIDYARDSLVCSVTKLVVSQARQERRAEILSLEEGQVVTGIVESTTYNGVTVSLSESVSAYCPRDLLAHTYTRTDSFQIGTEFTAKIIKIVRGSKREKVTLSRKAILPDPWDAFAKEKVGRYLEVRAAHELPGDGGWLFEIDEFGGVIARCFPKDLPADIKVQEGWVGWAKLLRVSKKARKASISLQVPELFLNQQS